MINPGLCLSCKWSNAIKSGKGSVFWQCGRHFEDDAYPKYPPIPVMRCRGYERADVRTSPPRD